MGTDLRRLISEGANPDRLLGVDIQRDFFEIGYELFEDRDRVPDLFIYGDFFQSGEFVSNIKEAMLKRRDYNDQFRKFDVVVLGSVIHLLDEEGIVMLLRMVLEELLCPGGMVIGRTLGTDAPGVFEFGAVASRYLHSNESLSELMGRIGYVGVDVAHNKREAKGGLDKISFGDNNGQLLNFYGERVSA